MSAQEITISLFDGSSGRTDSMPVSVDMRVSELLQLATALFGVDGDDLVLIKDAKPLDPARTVRQAGVKNGDLLAVSKKKETVNPSTSGGLDFSNLLSSNGSGTAAASAGGGLDFSNLLDGTAAPAAASASHKPVYYQGMSLDDAMHNNPHPNQIVQLLREDGPTPHLFKELNHHNPVLAQKLRSASTVEQAAQVWRQHTVTAGIQSAMRQTKFLQKQQEYQRRLQQNPNDAEAKEYFRKQKNQKIIQQQYFQAMQEYPESMTKVLMLYIETTINGHAVQTFVDSGAQMSVMSKSCARRCGLLDFVDTRFAGYALGVGKGKILGRVHIAHLRIKDVHFPFTITVMDNEALPSDTAGAAGPTHQDMDFLLGLDMMKRHQCTIDLKRGVLRFESQDLETPFLHEKDLDPSKGGTKGFDANKSNDDLMEMQKKQKDEGDDEDEDDNHEMLG